MTEGYNLAHWLSTLASPSSSHTRDALKFLCIDPHYLNGSVAPVVLLLSCSIYLFETLWTCLTVTRADNIIAPFTPYAPVNYRVFILTLKIFIYTLFFSCLFNINQHLNKYIEHLTIWSTFDCVFVHLPVQVRHCCILPWWLARKTAPWKQAKSLTCREIRSQKETTALSNCSAWAIRRGWTGGECETKERKNILTFWITIFGLFMQMKITCSHITAMSESMRPYLLTGCCDSSIRIPNLVTLIQNYVMPIPALQGVLHDPHGWVWSY